MIFLNPSFYRGYELCQEFKKYIYFTNIEGRFRPTEEVYQGMPIAIKKDTLCLYSPVNDDTRGKGDTSSCNGSISREVRGPQRKCSSAPNPNSSILNPPLMLLMQPAKALIYREVHVRYVLHQVLSYLAEPGGTCRSQYFGLRLAAVS